MVFIENWDDFQKAVVDLYQVAPDRTRYLAKYRHCEGKLELKVTDGPVCLKYKTDRSQDLKKFERLNRILMSKMQQRKEVDAMQVDDNIIPAEQAAPMAPVATTASLPAPSAPAPSKPQASTSAKQTPTGSAGGRKGKKKSHR
ncbi:signal recognition particle SRP9 SRP14 subunit [Polychytrium aggregatum]|uniref:signal recognition particle SRP9 SRP14 subunit n=1 Tax=Polychytrium aggregatum TaxID=110093 RepID=UPI0022FE2AE3|nr:signal recognition particle SRP9 SRP14 subunit [Polychytrium aggregatum]KAI9202378.1 signal recognition particle SRP9 SRP14 subunit [Polychytrium aggregatum]